MFADDSLGEDTFLGKGGFLRQFVHSREITRKAACMVRHPHALEEPEPSRGTTIYNSLRELEIDGGDTAEMMSGSEFDF